MTNPVYEEQAKLAAALTSPVRLRALNHLFQGEKSIDQLADSLGESHANMTAHLKALRTAGLVTATRRGKRVFHAATPEALRLFMALREATEALSAPLRLHARAGTNASVSSLTVEEFAQRARSRSEIVVDLRPASEYAAGHLPGAVSAPFDELDERLPQFGAKRRLLVYCRGKYCPRAREGTSLLVDAGLRAQQLAFGVPEWVVAGHSPEVGAA
jgi:DNA-binding transcriptional ArsR family regulator/rhodanese-related sulfurtransferase